VWLILNSSGISRGDIFEKSKLKNLQIGNKFVPLQAEIKIRMKYLQNKYVKLVVAGLIILWAVYQFTERNIWNGIALIFLSLVPIFLYFRNEYILLTFLRLRKQDFVGMEKWLGRIKDPETALIRKQQGYYNYMYGVIYSQKNLTQAEKYFRKALQLGLSMDFDLAMVKLSLAGIMMQKRKKREAQELLSDAKKLDKQKMLTDQIKMLQQQLKKI
jgi:membrane protein